MDQGATALRAERLCSAAGSRDARERDLLVISSSLALLRLLTGYRRLLVMSGVLALMQSALVVPTALLARYVLDTQAPSGDTRGIVITGIAAGLLTVASS